MAFASIGTLGTGANTTANTTLVLTTSAAAEAGNLVVLVIGKDNASTVDAETSEITGIADSAGGNTWVKYGEYCNGQGAANAGATVSVWTCIVTNTISSGGTITATLSDTRTVKAMTAWEFSVGAGSTVSLAGTLQVLANDALDPGSMSISGLTSKEYLFVRGVSHEGSVGLLTATTSYTKFTDILGATGTAASSMASLGEFIILTGTGSTSDPTVSARDSASVFLALEEVPAATANTFLFGSNF